MTTIGDKIIPLRNPSGFNLPWNVDFNLSVGGSPRLFVDGVVGRLHIVVDLEEGCPDEVPVQGEGVLPGLLPNLGTGVGVRLKRESRSSSNRNQVNQGDLNSAISKLNSSTLYILQVPAAIDGRV